MARILTLANQKGGVGKTSLAVHLATAFALREEQTLLIDADPQANATFLLGVEADREHTLEAYLDDKPPSVPALPSLASPAYLHVVPAWITMTEIEDWDNPVKPPDPSVVARRVYETIEASPYRWVIIDSPPSLSYWLHVALRTADRALVPIAVTGVLPLLGLSSLTGAIERTRLRYNPRLKLLGIVGTMVDGRTIFGRMMRNEGLPGVPPELMFTTFVPKSTGLQNAQMERLTLFDWDPRSDASMAMVALVKEVEARWQGNRRDMR